MKMNIPLDEFEHLVPDAILQRGYNYFNKGRVVEFVELSQGEYEAIVSGSEDYTVQLTLHNHQVTDYLCDCPYDGGPICKHIVAAILYLQQNILKTIDITSLQTQMKKKTKPINQQVKELLNTISQDDLKAFIQDCCKQDKTFRALFLNSFGHLATEHSKTFYQEQIQAILESFSQHHDYIDWSMMGRLVQAIDPFFLNAQKSFDHQNYENVIFICTALMEELVEVLQYADDSNGDIGYLIDASSEMLLNLTSESLGKDTRYLLFQYCIDAFKGEKFEGWDWHTNMLEIAAELIENDQEMDIVLNCLDLVGDKYNYLVGMAFHIKLKIFRKYKTKEEVTQLVEQNLNLPSVRQEEIEIALQNKNYERAIRLAQDGVQQDQNSRPGLVGTWYDYLLKVAQAQKDKAKIIKYARYRLIDNFSPTQDYYQIAKDQMNPHDWEVFVDQLITEIKSKGRWNIYALIRGIYIREAQWDKLLMLLKTDLSLQNIEQNEQYLAKDYSQKLLDWYYELIPIYVEKNMGRNHYQTACRYLRRMKKLGGKAEAQKLIEFLKGEYPRRKALLEELNQV